MRPFELSGRVRSVALAAVAALMVAAPARAGTLVYTPTNPTFGGNPLNGSTLLNSAQVQNQHQPSSSTTSSSTSLTQGQIFAQQLTSQLYASLANSITQAIFGSNAAPSGTFSFAGTTISYTNDGTNVHLTINDGTTTTTITLPANAISH
ncbi:curli assembly protein CsgF [Bradyrhizobium sp.]|uniref:curli assembly protein CsgF n=1 Tax=Bradyrhizobium sp. TaxID=376 RepID=UPI0039E55564